MFTWTGTSSDATSDADGNAAHVDMKQIALAAAEINGDVQFSCSYSETRGNYGTVQVSDKLMASHTTATADANDLFATENGALKVTTSTANGTDYALSNGALTVNNGFTGTITSTATFNSDAQTREIDFIYDHNGMRTTKIVSENGRTETTGYTLHGKLIAHLTKRASEADNSETLQNLHSFYDAQSKPAFVEYNGDMYRYVHNLQGDIVGIIDNTGNLMVEYKYDAWGKPLSIIGTLKTTLGEYNPFRYRGYVWDTETELYYLRSRYYVLKIYRFLNADANMGNTTLMSHNIYAYCINQPISYGDPTGRTKKVFRDPIRGQMLSTEDYML